jgi:DoxX-like family
VGRKIIYWVTTGLVSAFGFISAFTYLSGSPRAVQGFAHVGQPQQLRIILGIAKPLGASRCWFLASRNRKSGRMQASRSLGFVQSSRITWRETGRKR